MVSDKIRRQMYEAIGSGDLQATLGVVRKHPDILQANWNGSDSFLHLAAMKGQDRICEALIDAGIGVDSSGDGKTTLLETAAGHGRLSTVTLLLDKGALVDGAATAVATPLMGASVDGHLDIVKVLLDAGAEINREHLRLPQTALDFAVFYQVKKTGQLEVADFLRSHGAIRPYTEKHDWNRVPGQQYIEHIERAVGGFVNPLVVSRIELGKREAAAIHRVRIPKKYDYQLLFTVGLASSGFELAVCLPSAWPLNRSTLQVPRFNWPIRMLSKLSAAQRDGLSLKHGELLTVGHPALDDVEGGDGIKQWVVTLSQIIEAERKENVRIARTLLFVPVTTKKPVDSGARALAFADEKSKAKWDKVAVNVVHTDSPA